MRSSTHTIDAEFEIKFRLPDMPNEPGEYEVAYPTARVTYSYLPGRPAYTPRGEYGPIDPPDPAEVELITAELIDGDGLMPNTWILREWADEWLQSDAGYERACNAAEDDRHSMRNVR
jgi:hypothetical protein